MTTLDALERAARTATSGEWYHCQPFQTVPKQRTIHGSVPAQRVDYVSTWPGPGTPKGHRIIADMEGRESAMRSEDMAFIARANPATILALISEIRSLRDALEPFADAGRIIDGPFGPALFVDDDDAFKTGCSWTENGERKTLTWGDFRRAARTKAGEPHD